MIITEDNKRQNEISFDEEGSQSRTIDTDSSDRESTATYNGSLHLNELYTTKKKLINIEPPSHQLKT